MKAFVPVLMFVMFLLFLMALVGCVSPAVMQIGDVALPDKIVSPACDFELGAHNTTTTLDIIKPVFNAAGDLIGFDCTYHDMQTATASTIFVDTGDVRKPGVLRIRAYLLERGMTASR